MKHDQLNFRFNMSKAVLISGATGKQGGSVIRALLKQKADFQILALTRDAQSSSAQKLLKLSPNVKIVTGNLDNPRDIFQKAKAASTLPIWGVFSVQLPALPFGTEGSEEKQGKALLDAALENGVKHFVYTSADRGGARSDSDPTDVPHFISKYNIEQHIYEKTKNSNMTWTVLRPVAFFENLTPNFFGKVFATSFDMSLRKDQKLQFIATSDIGYFAAQAFIKPDEYKNRQLSLAGDELTYDQFKAEFEKTTGQTLPTTYWFVTRMIHWMSKELGYMFRWFRNVGFGADIPALKKMNPEIKTFSRWLREESQFKAS